jgi:hypothetical protein
MYKSAKSLSTKAREEIAAATDALSRLSRIWSGPELPGKIHLRPYSGGLVFGVSQAGKNSEEHWRGVA